MKRGGASDNVLTELLRVCQNRILKMILNKKKNQRFPIETLYKELSVVPVKQLYIINQYCFIPKQTQYVISYSTRCQYWVRLKITTQ